jgi:FkbM family methyltransferase
MSKSIRSRLKAFWIGFKYPELKKLDLQLHPEGEFISDQIRKTGLHYELKLLLFIKEHFDFSRFVDIGANIGNHCNFFGRFGATGWAFEPSRRNFEKLVRNAPGFKCYNMALSDKKGTEELVTFDSCLGNSYVKGAFDGRIRSAMGTGIKTEKIEVDMLDNLNIEDPTLIKIDVEGSELKVLKGALKTLKKYGPVLCLEIHQDSTLADSKYPYTRAEIENFLSSIGYKKYLSFGEINHFYTKK